MCLRIPQDLNNFKMDEFRYSYIEQSMIQLDQLQQLIMDEQSRRTRYQLHHLMYRKNIYEDSDSRTQQRLKTLLCNALKSMGHQLHENLNPSGEFRQFPVVNLTHRGNFTYDNLGVIHLKPKETIKYTLCNARKQALMLHVTAKILDLIQNDRYMTNRELYYKSGELCQRNMSKLAEVLTDLCCLLGCSKIHLHIICQAKGLVYGDLKYKLKTGEIVDCSSNKWGVAIPTPHTPIVDVTSGAKFIIILEKDSVMQKILSQEESTHFVERYKAILFTAKGYPDMNSRAFIHFLWTKLKIPILALTDADPHGIEIVCCYKFGSHATVNETQLTAVPHIRWLGLLPSDVRNHSLPESQTMPLTENDAKKIESLLKRPYLVKKSDWISQIQILTNDLKRKAELESIDIDGEYLVRTYLPNKLRFASWL